jgi:hypothetical protein
MKIPRSERVRPQPTPEVLFEVSLLAWFRRSLPGQGVRLEITPPHTLRGAKVRVNRLARLAHRRIQWAPERRPVLRVEAIEQELEAESGPPDAAD